MPEDVPVIERRRIVIEYEIRVPSGSAAPVSVPAPSRETPNIDELAEAVRRELIRTGVRNGTAGIP